DTALGVLAERRRGAAPAGGRHAQTQLVLPVSPLPLVLNDCVSRASRDVFCSMRFADLIRGAWRRTVPRRLRRQASHLWKSPGTEVRRYVRALRWMAMSQQRRASWSRDYN